MTPLYPDADDDAALVSAVESADKAAVAAITADGTEVVTPDADAADAAAVAAIRGESDR
ncbi:MAG TPA: hypothetical protein VG142_11890 [Trebonia sp.]|jgi:hypothetical protein|nr:hypothetical protein [Trebonia sp.]